MTPVRLTIRLTITVLITSLTGCSDWRIGEASHNYTPAQGQITGPAPALLTFTGPDGEGFGTVTALQDGRLLTAAHVLHGSIPLQLDGESIHALDIARWGRGESETIMGYVGDWVEFRAEPFDAPGWQVSDRRPEAGDNVIIRGYTLPFDVTGQPLLQEVRVRVREAPWWIKFPDHRHYIYVVPPSGDSNIDFHGMSGGPVLLQDAATCTETLVGIYSGTITAKWLIFRSKVWVIQPWPPDGDSR